jgi:hypothetical protein
MALLRYFVLFCGMLAAFSVWRFLDALFFLDFLFSNQGEHHSGSGRYRGCEHADARARIWRLKNQKKKS